MVESETHMKGGGRLSADQGSGFRVHRVLGFRVSGLGFRV